MGTLFGNSHSVTVIQQQSPQTVEKVSNLEQELSRAQKELKDLRAKLNVLQEERVQKLQEPAGEVKRELEASEPPIKEGSKKEDSSAPPAGEVKKEPEALQPPIEVVSRSEDTSAQASVQEVQALETSDSLAPYYKSLGSEPNLWDKSEDLPQWLKEYFAWHQAQRALINETNWRNFRYIAQKAIHGHRQGGTTDRMRGITHLLRTAADSKRIALIYWNRPFALEEYLMPPLGGMDWRVPRYMIDGVINGAGGSRRKAVISSLGTSFDGTYGDIHYDAKREEGEKTAIEAFRDIWNVVYTPAPPLAKLIYEKFATLGMSVAEYATVHLRVSYINKTTKISENLINLVANAINCASEMRPGGPFFVATDTKLAMDVALEYGRKNNVTIFFNPTEGNPLHIQHFQFNETWPIPSAFYDGFLDIYLMSESKCVTHGAGGFGHWARWLGHNSSCIIRHAGRKVTNPKKCNWTPGDTTPPPPKLPAFPEPMPPGKDPNTDLPRAY